MIFWFIQLSMHKIVHTLTLYILGCTCFKRSEGQIDKYAQESKFFVDWLSTKIASGVVQKKLDIWDLFELGLPVV